MQDNFKMIGQLTITKTDMTGQVVESLHVPNLVVTTGKNFVASRMVGTSSNVMSHMAVGTSTTAASASDTALITPLGGWSRQAFNVAASVSGNAVTYSANFPAGTGYSGAITEAGIFNDPTAGTMLCRTVFPVVNKADGDAINITWTVTAA